MDMIDKALGVHAQALGLRSKRIEVLARNIANADTPHFKAKDIDFKSVLKQTKESRGNIKYIPMGHQSLQLIIHHYFSSQNAN